MASLSLALLGPFEGVLNGEPLPGFRTNKVQALLLYLAAEPGTNHSREKLMTLLWPGLPDASARLNLRQSLYHLRRTLHDLPGKEPSTEGAAPILLSDRKWLKINPAADLEVDVQLFSTLIDRSKAHVHADMLACNQCSDDLTQAIGLYRGDFLSDFYLEDSNLFEEWAASKRESLRRVMLEALDTLTRIHLSTGDYRAAQSFARRQLEIDLLHEGAYRQLMLSLALDSQRNEALAQYKKCRQILNEELGVEPEAETTALYDKILAGDVSLDVGQIKGIERYELREQAFRQALGDSLGLPKQARPEIPIQLPEFLAEMKEEPEQEAALVAREDELKQLEDYLEKVSTGQGTVLFISGEAGAGKTALASGFARQAQEKFPDLLLGLGNCNAHTGSGDPYLPFRGVLGSLTGDVEHLWQASTLTQEQAQRQWRTLPETAQVLTENGPDLIGNFLSARQLLARVTAAVPGGADWLPELQTLAGRNRTGHGDMQQQQYFEQYARVLQALSSRRPLLIILDDLQWVDSASTNLLFHLGRNLKGSRILILGLYRPDEIAISRSSTAGAQAEPHPMQKVLNEFRRQLGDITISLDRANVTGGSAFLEALLDTEPNRLGTEFREMLFKHTGGQPMFSVEILRTMQERGDLVQDGAGRWVEGPALDWETFPARIEGVIEERITRLEEEVQETLTVASVEGEDFTAQVVARVREVADRELLRQLSHELDKKHRLVGEQGVEQFGRQKVYRYRFRHSLFQQYLYNDLGKIEREVLHLEVGQALESLYEERAEEIASQLAWHFAEAGEIKKAVGYLNQAGDQARNLFAYEEAVSHYEQALEFLKQLGEIDLAARTLMKLGLTHHNAFAFRRARQAYAEGFALWQQAYLAPSPGAFQPASHPLRLAQDEPTTLDPGNFRYTTAYIYIKQLFRGLVQLTAEMDIVPDVAQSWEVLEEGRRYRFNLRNDVYWSDGAQVTAEDFAFAWRRVLSPENHSTLPPMLFTIKNGRDFHHGRLKSWQDVGVKVIDALTLEVTLENPDSTFLYLMSIAMAFAVPKHHLQDLATSGSDPASVYTAWPGWDELVTNGPFRLKKWEPARKLLLGANPSYHGHRAGNVESVEVIFTKGDEDITLYQEDRLDMIYVYEGNVVTARSQFADDYISSPYLQTSYLGFNTRIAPFDDSRVRRALALATDRERLNDTFSEGLLIPASGGSIPLGTPGHVAGIALPFDPEEARRLLAEAGYEKKGSFPSVQFLFDPRGDYIAQKIYEFLTSQWNEILGIEVEVATLPLAAYRQQLETDTPAIFDGGWIANFPDPSDPLETVRYLNTGWVNEDYEQLLQKARETMDQEKRLALFRKAEEILVEEAPIIPLSYALAVMLVKPWVRRFPISPIDLWFWKDVVIEPH